MIIHLEDYATGVELEDIVFDDSKYECVPRAGEYLHFWDDHVGVHGYGVKGVTFKVVEVVHDLRSIYVPGKKQPQSFAHIVTLKVVEV